MMMTTESRYNGDGEGQEKKGRKKEVGKPLIVMVCGTLVYYHCAYGNSSLLSLVSDVFIVLLCSLAILGLLFRQMNISVPVDPLEWQISQDTSNNIFASLANTIGAAESVLRVAATGHDKRLFLKVVASLYMLSALGRLVSGVTVAYAGNWSGETECSLQAFAFLMVSIGNWSGEINCSRHALALVCL